MDFDFIISKSITLDQQGIGIFETSGSRTRVLTQGEQNLSQVINVMGERSAIAQSLKQVITSYEKMRGGNQKLYIAADGRVCFGILKVGPKNLFYRDMAGTVKEISPLCVLDFYVHENCQRQGYGKILFEKMLQIEKITPEKIAYDRPSPKLLSFLKKHYGLSKHVTQNNNFVVFDAYFRAPVESSYNPVSNGRAASQVNLESYLLSRQPQQQQLPPQQSHYVPTSVNQRNQIQVIEQNPIDKSNNNSISRHHKEFLNAGRAILSQDDVYREGKNIQNIENNGELNKRNQYGSLSQKQGLFGIQKGQLNEIGQNQPQIQYGSQQNQQQSQQASLSKLPVNYHDKKLDKIHQKIEQTEKELALVNQQIQKQRNHLSDPVSHNIASQTSTNGPSPWANTGLNYYQTSSQNYGNYYTYYRK